MFKIIRELINIKREQLKMEWRREARDNKRNRLLAEILKVLKGGKENGRNNY